MKFKDWDEKVKVMEAMGFVQKLDKGSDKKSSSKNSIIRDVEEPKDMNKAIDKFLKGLDRVMQDYFKRMKFTNLSKPEHGVNKGGRYIKVWRKEGSSQSVVAFIDNKEGPTYGAIYKPASWKAPAKGIRGNIFSTQNGLEAIGPQGTVFYLR